MTNRNEGITIYLTIGKEVKLNFDSENNLSSIRLSINNGLFDLSGYHLIDREEKLTDKIEKYEKEVEENQQKKAKEKRKEHEI